MSMAKIEEALRRLEAIGFESQGDDTLAIDARAEVTKIQEAARWMASNDQDPSKALLYMGLMETIARGTT